MTSDDRGIYAYQIHIKYDVCDLSEKKNREKATVIDSDIFGGPLKISLSDGWSTTAPRQIKTV